VSSGDYGTTVEDDNVYSSVSRDTSSSLSSIVTLTDSDTASTPNSTISAYIIGLQDATSKTFSISATGDNESYTVDGKADPTLTLIRGQTYTFDRSDTGHALQIQAAANGAIGTAYGTTEGVAAGTDGDFTFTVASDAPATLYYQCATHTAMGGQINIVDNLGTITYTDDDTSAATTITAKASSSGSGFLNSLSAAEFASANYVSAPGNDDNQKIYAVARDSSGVSSVDTNALTAGVQGLTVPVDTSGIIKYRFITADSGVTISETDGTVLIEGNSSTTQTLTAALVGTPTADVNIIIDAPDDLTLTGSGVSVVSAAENTFLIKLDSSDPDDTFTVSALSIADSDGVTETVTLTYSTVSTDTAFNSLSIPSTDFTVQENIASFSVSDVTFSSGTNVAEGSTNTGTYTVTANGLGSSDTLTLNLSGSGLEFSSATTFDLTEASPTATIVVTAEDDTAIEAGTLGDGVHSHAVTHAIYENDSLSSNYLNAIANKSVSVSDNDDISSAKTVSISDGSSSSSTAIPDSLTVNLIDSSSSPTSFTSSSGAISVASDLTISHVELGNLSSVYTSDISISDVVLQLRDIVGLQTLSGQAKEAADVNNNGTVTISDVVSVLRDIVGLETISTFDLVDSSGYRVSTLGPSMTDASLLLVQNGDVDLSGSFMII
jgi:plastocyanin